MTERLISTTEAATLAGVAPVTIRLWCKRGLLHPTARYAGTMWFRVADVDAAEFQARQRDYSGRSRRRLT